MNQVVKKNALVNVLVIGGGGREHALAWKLAQSNRVHKVFVAPGNGGTALDSRMENINITEPGKLLAWAATNDIALTLVGPEQPLAAGVVDLFRSQGMRIFGPTAAAAQLESSKAFSKAFMRRHGIPTADYDTFTDPAAAHAFVDRLGAPIVVKADGLAAGKGVVVAMNIVEAHAAIDFMLVDNTPGNALGIKHNSGGSRVVIEQFLTGEEASFIVMCDGKNVAVMATSQDHKRLLDGDLGPNTGGMGAYSPAPIVTPDVYNRAMREVIFPTIKGMAEDGIPFTGFLYAGLMIETEGENKGQIKTLEFNCRMGDPETQPIMMRLKSDFFEVLWAATEPGAHGRLDKIELEWDRRTALGVVVAAHGYPMSPRQGDAIAGLPGKDSSVGDDAVVFHAGTATKDGQTTTSGGRVLCVTVLAESVKKAQLHAYEVVQSVQFAGAQYRKDIGHKAIKT